MNKKKVLVVGGAGYVGGAVVDLLIENSFDVIVYDSLVYEESFLKNVKFVLGDIRNQRLLNKYLKWADSVVWMAAIVGDGACSIDHSLTTDVNYLSVKFLCKNFSGRIVFFSTCSVYGAQNSLLNERSKTNPLSLYATTKLQAENILKNKNAIIFRLGTLFGLGDSYSRIRMDLVLNTLTLKAVKEKRLVVYGGKQYRPLLHVKDAARAIILGLKYDKVNGIFNLHYKNITIIDLAIKIKKFFGKIKLEKVNVKYQDTRNYRVDGTKIYKALKFVPKFDIDYGIKEISSLLKENRIKDVYNIRYINEKFLNKKNEKKK
jgi:nucleoside-diphosphate-sugar epimerase